MSAFKTIEHAGCTIEVHFDDEPPSPRDWDNATLMYCWHPRYTLGDEQFTRNDFETLRDVVDYLTDERKITELRPLFLYEHGGISISVGAPNAFDVGGWDTTMVGFVGLKPDHDVTPGHEEDVIKGDVSTYDDFLTGQVFGYVVERDGEEVDSCWGYYGEEDMIAEAKASAEHAEREATKEATEAAYWADRGVPTV